MLVAAFFLYRPVMRRQTPSEASAPLITLQSPRSTRNEVMDSPEHSPTRIARSRNSSCDPTNIPQSLGNMSPRLGGGCQGRPAVPSSVQHDRPGQLTRPTKEELRRHSNPNDSHQSPNVVAPLAPPVADRRHSGLSSSGFPMQVRPRSLDYPSKMARRTDPLNML